MSAPSQSKKLSTGILAALVGAVTGAGLWAALVTVSDYKVGYAAVGVGALAGFLAGRFGGADPRLPFIAAAIGLVGCLLGDLIADAHAVSVALGSEGISASGFEVLRKMFENPSFGWDVYQAGFKGLDVAFYAFAALAAFRLATKHGALASTGAVAAPPVTEPAATPVQD
jgi:hypothetical protein